MEPFIQRMLERAKVRREKLDEQLINAGHDVKRQRSPLKDANILLEQATAAATASKSPSKSPIKVTKDNSSPVKSPCKSPGSKNLTSETNEFNELNKENGKVGTCNARAKLQRLGKLYSDDNSYGLSSPIHKTEEKFSAEEDNIAHKSARKGARLDRLAALASTINNWEDDLSHPILNNAKAKSPDIKVEKIQAKFNEQVKTTSEPQPSTSRDNKWITVSNEKKQKDPSSVKQLKWDRNILDSLEAQGFSRTKSNSRLVYDYKHCSQESNADTSHLSPNKFTRQVEEKKQISFDDSPKSKKTEDYTSASPSDSSKSSDSKCSSTLERVTKSANTTNSSRLSSRTGFNSSQKTLVQPSGSVLSKASIFETKNVDTKIKDPAQMSLAERMAFFERNKGQAPLIPKAPLTMSIPPKKLQEKDKCNMQSGSIGNADSSPLNNRNFDIPNKTVLEQRAIFEQVNNRNKVEEMENHILQTTYAERQRELHNVFRIRFNTNNKDIVRAESAVRTSESSEGGGKSSSPKSSLVCPVKPTPAPDNVTLPPPPPPLPLEIISCQTKSSIKRQVVGSPPKIQHPSTSHDIKRIRVCPPKAGTLYPNLSEIEVTDSETDTEYTTESTETVTAILDEKSDSATEADYYVQNDEIVQETESEQEENVKNTSFGRSIMHELNERSLFNKKRSIEPDPDSCSTTDISVLDEIDQYLDECFEKQEKESETREEGPTPPKMNKNGKSSLAVYNFKSPLKVVSPISSKKTDSCVEDNGEERPVLLVRTVSAYRRQQSELTKTPLRSTTQPGSDPYNAEKRENESILVENKMKQLMNETCTQQKKIEEASKALNLCQSTIEFNGSSEHVGGEWALLVATHKRQAALNEMQRLRREGTLKPVKAGSSEIRGSGSLTISAITLPLKQEYFRNMDMNRHLHCICLMYYLGEVVATQASTAEHGDSCIRFISMLKLDDLHSDFKINVEVYFLETQPKYLPHEKKYHINHNAKAANKTPKKKNQFVMPDIQSPAGPNVIRSPAFQLTGSAIITLRDINREQFTLHRISSHSPFEGILRMHICRKLVVSVEHHGFLTIFEDISNLGFWHRRWCWLKDAKLYYWVHPEDEENEKNPVGHLDLEDIFTKNVQFVNREKCARPFTFLLETSRAAQPGDADGLIMKTNGIETTIEHFLLADTREEGLQWMSKFNKTLNLIRAWGPFRDPA